MVDELLTSESLITREELVMAVLKICPVGLYYEMLDVMADLSNAELRYYFEHFSSQYGAKNPSYHLTPP